jgi:hypothetical protein
MQEFEHRLMNRLIIIYNKKITREIKIGHIKHDPIK